MYESKREKYLERCIVTYVTVTKCLLMIEEKIITRLTQASLQIDNIWSYVKSKLFADILSKDLKTLVALQPSCLSTEARGVTIESEYIVFILWCQWPVSHEKSWRRTLSQDICAH